MDIREILETFNLSISTLRDWSKKSSSKHKLFLHLRSLPSKNGSIQDSEVKSDDTEPMFDPKAKTVKLDKSWFFTDMLWSSRDGVRIGIDRLITIYMNNPYQQHTDRLVDLFGRKRVERCVKGHIKDPATRLIGLQQLEYAGAHTRLNKASMKIERKLKTDKLLKVMYEASQKQIDRMYNRLGAKKMYVVADQADYLDTSLPIRQKIEYADRRHA